MSSNGDGKRPAATEAQPPAKRPELTKLSFGMVTVIPHGQPWAEIMKDRGDASITHVWGYDGEPTEAFAKRYGAARVAHPSVMLNHIDAMLLPGGRRMPEGARDTLWSETEPLGLRPSEHDTLAAPFLEAGIPVLIDKPFADSMDEARRILAARDRGRTFVMSCSALRYDDQIIAARSLIQSGSIGAVRAVTVTMGAGSMSLPWLLIHSIEALTSIFGCDVRSVSYTASDGGFPVGQHTQPHAQALQLVYADGPLVNITLVYEPAKREKGERLVPLDFVPPQYLTLFYNFHFFGTLDHLEVSLRGKNYYRRKIAVFCDAVRAGEAPLSDEDMLGNTRINLACAEAMRTGGRVSPADM